MRSVTLGKQRDQREEEKRLSYERERDARDDDALFRNYRNRSRR